MHSSNLKWYTVILLLILILCSLIFLSINNAFYKNSRGVLLNSQSADFSIFDTVTASVSGKITKDDGNKISFENLKGAQAEALKGEGLLIADLSTMTLSTPSADLKRIQINKTANMIIQIRDGKYYVVSITYPQP